MTSSELQIAQPTDVMLMGDVGIQYVQNQAGRPQMLAAAAGLFPEWVPKAARNYIFHTVDGRSIRRLARDAGCHASTILRQVRKMEFRRDDPLIDEALTQLARPDPEQSPNNNSNPKDGISMTKQFRHAAQTPDDATVQREARRILRRLCEPAACLAVAQDMEKAVVVREAEDGSTTRTAVVDRPVAQAMALKDWIACAVPGRVSRYQITGAGRAALKGLLADEDAVRGGFAEAPTEFIGQFGGVAPVDCGEPSRKQRYNYAESPITAMARRRDKSGKPFLNAELVSAAERLREDFEVAQMGPRAAQHWEALLSGTPCEPASENATPDASSTARARVSEALRDLGPGLGDVALRVCCFLEGLEAAEKRMGWSARSGKVVLRIALQRLKQHYDAAGNGAMIG